MNRENIRVLFRNYIDHFETLNNSEHEEMYKWNAIGAVQDNWDLTADNVSEMIKKAFSDSHTLINNRIVQPVSGLIALANADSEFVRKAFLDLLTEDGGNIESRQNRILAFVDGCNAKMEKCFPGKWKYLQDMRSAISYLAMIKPQENYLFKSTAAHFFARYMECGDDIGAGSTFSLRNYYRMCDQLVEEIRNCPELLETDAKRLTNWKDTSFHVLAYDLIFCLNAYELHAGMKEPPVKGKSSNVQQKAYRREQAERLQKEMDDLQDRIDEIGMRIREIEDYNFVGEALKTRAFGVVKILRQHENLLYFEANGQMKSFALPGCIAKGFLLHDDLELVESYKKKYALLEEVKILDNQQRLKAMEFNRYTN